jgi:hypothetical protein
MKSKLSKIWGIGLVITVLASLFMFSAPASAGTMGMSKETDYPSTTDNIFLSTTSDNWSIVDMAVSADGNTVYVVTNNDTGTTGKIYKSTNAGATFTQLTSPSTLTLPQFITIAPDDANYVLVAGDTYEAYVSTNAGSTFSSLLDTNGVITIGVSTLATMNDIAISRLDGVKHWLAIAGTDNGSTGGAVFYFNLGDAAPVWKNAASTASGQFTSAPEGTNDVFLAIAFSPNFPSDNILVAVSADNGVNGTINYHIASFNQKKWDSAVFDGYPKQIDTVTTAGNSLTANAAAVALDPDALIIKIDP